MNKFANVSDKIAIGLSFMCVLHCMALPLVLISLPTVTSLLSVNDEHFHHWLVFAVIPISLYAVITGYLQHKRVGILLVSTLGLTMLVSAILFGHDMLGETGEITLTLLGSTLVAISHIWNFRLRQCKQCDSTIKLN